MWYCKICWKVTKYWWYLTLYSSGPGINATQRKEVLHSFYKKVIGTFFSSGIEGSGTGISLIKFCNGR